MLELEQERESEDPEIELLKEWLPKIGAENRAFIKGASQALIYVQKNQGTPDCESFEEHTSAAL